MKKLIVLMGAFLVSLALTAPAMATLLTNGGAEDGTAGWTQTTTTGAIDAVQASGGVAPLEPDHFFAFSSNGDPVGMSQSGMGVWDPGLYFVFSGWYQTGSESHAVAQLTISWELSGIPVDARTITTGPLTSTSNTSEWEHFHLLLWAPSAFSVNAWEVTLSGYDIGSSSGGVFWDDLSLTPQTHTPEPATLFLLGSGMIGMAWVTRRKIRD